MPLVTSSAINTPMPTPAIQPSYSKPRLSVGAIVGVALGGLVCVAFAVVGIVRLSRRNQLKEASNTLDNKSSDILNSKRMVAPAQELPQKQINELSTERQILPELD
jgi:putative exporter of polyketide antibiotics